MKLLYLFICLFKERNKVMILFYTIGTAILSYCIFMYAKVQVSSSSGLGCALSVCLSRTAS